MHKKVDNVLEQDNDYFEIINPKTLLLKLGLRINTINYFKDERRPSISLTNVMFRGTYFFFFLFKGFTRVTRKR